MEPQNRDGQSVVIRLGNFPQLLAVGWIGLGLLLLLCFFLTNYTMALMNINGPELFRMSFRSSDSFRKIFDDSSFFMMVTVPILYLLLALGVGIAGIFLLQGKGKKVVLPLLCAAGFCFVYSLIGSMVIGREVADIAFFTKFMPKPTTGYYFALVLQLLIFGLGLMYFVRSNRKAAAVTA
jgi:hypothetical protein